MTQRVSSTASHKLLNGGEMTPVLTNILEFAGDHDHARIMQLNKTFQAAIKELQKRTCSQLRSSIASERFQASVGNAQLSPAKQLAAIHATQRAALGRAPQPADGIPSAGCFLAQRFVEMERVASAAERERDANFLILWNALVDALNVGHAVLPHPLPQTAAERRTWMNHDENVQFLDRVWMLHLTGLSQLPPEIGRLRELTSLTCDNHHFQEIPPIIEGLQRLGSLSLYGNQLRELPDFLARMPRLENIHMVLGFAPGIDAERLEAIQRDRVTLNLWRAIRDEFAELNIVFPMLPNPEGIRNWLNADANQAQLRRIQKLEVSDPCPMPREIGRLRGLRELSWNLGRTDECPDELALLTQLTDLELTGRTTRIYPVIMRLEDLDSLHISGGWNGEFALPEDLGNLRNLRSLAIRLKGLEEIPEGVFQMRALETLDLSQNQLEELPVEIGNLENLRELQLVSNGFQRIPAAVANLPRLQKLSMLLNEIQELPNEIYHSRLKANIDRDAARFRRWNFSPFDSAVRFEQLRRMPFDLWFRLNWTLPCPLEPFELVFEFFSRGDLFVLPVALLVDIVFFPIHLINWIITEVVSAARNALGYDPMVEVEPRGRG